MLPSYKKKQSDMYLINASFMIVSTSLKTSNLFKSTKINLKNSLLTIIVLRIRK